MKYSEPRLEIALLGDMSVFAMLRGFLDRHPAVKLIATRSTTHDHLELESCAKRHVTMCIVPSYGRVLAGGMR